MDNLAFNIATTIGLIIIQIFVIKAVVSKETKKEVKDIKKPILAALGIVIITQIAELLTRFMPEDYSTGFVLLTSFFATYFIIKKIFTPDQKDLIKITVWVIVSQAVLFFILALVLASIIKT